MPRFLIRVSVVGLRGLDGIGWAGEARAALVGSFTQCGIAVSSLLCRAPSTAGRFKAI